MPPGGNDNAARRYIGIQKGFSAWGVVELPHFIQQTSSAGIIPARPSLKQAICMRDH
jgi:hypothetical protein